MSNTKLHTVDTSDYIRPTLRLIVDESTAVQVGDRPIFGAQITISDSLSNLNGKVLLPGIVLGWVDYVETTKFGCLTSDDHYIDASTFLYVEKNQLVLAKPIKLIKFPEDIKLSKQIFSFCEA